MKLQPAVKKETKNTAIVAAIGTLLMFAVFFVLHLIWPEKIPFNWKVILSGVIGALVATGNFLLMAITVQRITELTDVSNAKKKMQASYNFRLLFMAGWIALAFLLPCFVGMAGLIPVLLPGTFLKIRGAGAALKKTDEKKAEEPLETTENKPGTAEITEEKEGGED